MSRKREVVSVNAPLVDGLLFDGVMAYCSLQARQDVMLTPEGPVELYRKDSNGRERSLNADKVTKLTAKYKNHKRQEYRRNASIKGNYDFIKPRVTYRHQDRRPARPSRPCPHSRDYNRLAVSGDKIIEKHPTRSYIYHRQPFDWYNSYNIEILDDIEEVIRVPGTLQRPHTKSIYDSPSICSSSQMYREPHRKRWYEDEDDDSYSDEYDYHDDYEDGQYSDYYDEEEDDFEDYSNEDGRHRHRRRDPVRSRSSSARNLRKAKSETRISDRQHADRVRMKSNDATRVRQRADEEHRSARRNQYAAPSDRRPTYRRNQDSYARRSNRHPIDEDDYEPAEYDDRRVRRRYADEEYDSEGSCQQGYDDYDRRSEDSLSDGSVEVTSTRRQRRVVIKASPKYDSDRDETSSSPTKPTSGTSKSRSHQPSYQVNSPPSRKNSNGESTRSIVTEMDDMYISKSSPTKTSRRPERIEETDNEEEERIVTNRYMPDEVEEVHQQSGRTVVKRIVTEVVKPGDPAYNNASSSVTFK